MVTKTPDEQRTVTTFEAGSLSEGIVALAAIVLTILGLVGVYPQLMLSVAAIVVGIALLVKGGVIAYRFSEAVSDTSATGESRSQIGAGVTADSVGGVLGIILGVMSILQIVPNVLLPVAAIIFGGALILSGTMDLRLSSLSRAGAETATRADVMTHEIVTSASEIEMLVGIASVVLGILSLINIVPITLSLIAFLSVSVALSISGMSLLGRVVSVFR